jgi:hypothetical protein
MNPIVATLCYGSLLSIPTAIDIVAKSVSVIYNLIDTMEKPNSHQTTDITKFIVQSDIRYKLQVYSLLLSEISDSNSKTVALCINNIQKIIQDIEYEMTIIASYIRYNNSLYLSVGWRLYSFNKNIEKLTDLLKLLDDRIHTLKSSSSIITLLGIKNTIDAELEPEPALKYDKILAIDFHRHSMIELDK